MVIDKIALVLAIIGALNWGGEERTARHHAA